MNKQEALEIFRGRMNIIENIEGIISATKKSKKYDLAHQGQLDLFGAGLEDVKKNNKLKPYTGRIDLMASVRAEMDSLGIPVTYDPLSDLQMYFDLYTTHNVSDLFEMNEDTHNIIVIDWITGLENKISQKGKPYVRIHTASFGADNYWFLWGKDYQRLISQVFINETYMFSLKFKAGDDKFPNPTISINHLRNIKDVDIDTEYERVINSAKIISELDEDWMIKNRK